MTGDEIAARILAITTAARHMLEQAWPDWHKDWGGPAPAIMSQWTCMYSSLFACTVLRYEGFDAGPRYGTPRQSEDGPFLGSYGFLSPDGWQPHSWVECHGLIIDVTADQFGADEIIITPATDARYSANDIDLACAQAKQRRQQRIKPLLDAWVQQRHISGDFPF